jgi:hypothetical protein
MIANHFGIHPYTEKMMNEDIRRHLSASGSRKVPRAVFWFVSLANRPSSISVRAAMAKRTSAYRY